MSVEISRHEPANTDDSTVDCDVIEAAIRNPQSAIQPARGQAAVIIALCMTLLIGIIGLALDGGAMFVQRRVAQNAADAMALAATRTMLTSYEEMLVNNPTGDVNGTALDESAISQTLALYATKHNITRSNIEAYYVSDTKEVVTTTQVGYFGGVPWTLGAKGIWVKSRSLTDSVFMRVFGWDKVGATANALAFMGISTDSADVSILPIGLYTTTLDINNIQFGSMYTLLDADVTQGSGNWGWVDFNGSGDPANVVGAWLECGFNPAVTQTQWEQQWCPSHDNAPGWGPTRHYKSALTSTYDPSYDPTLVPFLVHGAGSDGWWVEGSSGTVNANCHDFRQTVQGMDHGNGSVFKFPIFDKVDDSDGLKYHLRVIASFIIRGSDVDCHPQPRDPVTGERPPKWMIQGEATSFYGNASSGRQGDLRHNSGHVVFLDN